MPFLIHSKLNIPPFRIGSDSPGQISLTISNICTNDVNYTEDGQKRVWQTMKPLGTRSGAVVHLFWSAEENGGKFYTY